MTTHLRSQSYLFRCTSHSSLCRLVVGKASLLTRCPKSCLLETNKKTPLSLRLSVNAVSVSLVLWT